MIVEEDVTAMTNVMAMTTTTLTEQLAQTTAAACPEQMKHNAIISNVL